MVAYYRIIMPPNRKSNRRLCGRAVRCMASHGRQNVTIPFDDIPEDHYQSNGSMNSSWKSLPSSRGEIPVAVPWDIVSDFSRHETYAVASEPHSL